MIVLYALSDQSDSNMVRVTKCREAIGGTPIKDLEAPDIHLIHLFPSVMIDAT